MGLGFFTLSVEVKKKHRNHLLSGHFDRQCKGKHRLSAFQDAGNRVGGISFSRVLSSGGISGKTNVWSLDEAHVIVSQVLCGTAFF